MSTPDPKLQSALEEIQYIADQRQREYEASRAPRDEGPPDDELCACGNPNCMGIHGFGGAQRVALPPPGSPPCHRCATLEEEVRHLRYGYTEDDAKALGGALQVALHDFPTRCSVKSADFHNRLLVELLRLRVRVERAAALSGGSPEHEDCATMRDVVREVLCRIWDDGADVAMEEWHEWYKPSDWLWWGRALGAFIYHRNKQRAAPPSEPPGEDLRDPITYEQFVAWGRSLEAAGELREAARRVLALEPALRLKIITTADRERQAAIAALGAALARLDGQTEGERR